MCHPQVVPGLADDGVVEREPFQPAGWWIEEDLVDEQYLVILPCICGCSVSGRYQAPTRAPSGGIPPGQHVCACTCTYVLDVLPMRLHAMKKSSGRHVSSSPWI